MGDRFVAIAVLCLAGLPAAASAAAADLAKGLIAHYTFDKDASDASGKGHHATNHGATPAPKGKIGGAFAFDGKDDHVRVPVKATQGLLRFTLAMWIKTTQTDAKPRQDFWQNSTLIGAATPGWSSGDLGLMLEKGCVAYFHGLRDGGSDMSWFSGAAVSDDRWHHIALVDEGPRVLLYVDGRLVRGEAFARSDTITYLGLLSQTASGLGLGTTPLFIGACADAHGTPTAKHLFRGLIDDLRIWTRALTAAEVAALTSQAVTPRRPTP